MPLPKNGVAKKRLRLPLWAHFWRGRHWDAITRAEEKRGGALRLSQQIQNRVADFRRRKENGLLSIDLKPLAEKTAKAVVLWVSELADELENAERVSHQSSRAWSQIYENVMRHYWKSFPVEIRREIIRQSRQK